MCTPVPVFVNVDTEARGCGCGAAAGGTVGDPADWCDPVTLLTGGTLWWDLWGPCRL